MIEPRRRTVPLTFDLPWEIVELIAVHGPALVAVAQAALRSRQVVVLADTRAKEETDAACDAQIAEWRKLAKRCESEIRRRANTEFPSAAFQKGVIREIAREIRMKPVDLELIVRVHGERAGKPKTRKRVLVSPSRRLSDA